MRPAKILVVDDEPHLLKLVRSNLEAAHYKVTVAMDGPSALAMMEGEGADLVVLDKNPLDDILNTHSINAVYIGGKKFE